jgi:serine/threonine protein kinase/predicted ATPase
MKCSQCHAENPDDSRFCSKCGTQLLPSEEIPPSATKTLQTPTEELTKGTTFASRYEIIEELGKGGMGKVYRVMDKKIDEEVALKLLNPEVAADEKTIKRFRNELKFARKITHKNVCRMYHLSEEEGTSYITMEYVPGEDLKSFIRKSGQITTEKALSISKQVCEGLAEAHKLGVVHRDLKPQNIMIDKEGNARIMDFGIARSVEAKGVTEVGMIIGTPDYMSPEQVEGKEADQRSDIYSLGIIIYEMVTGKVPFEGDTPLSIALKHKTETPSDPREFNDQISEDLSSVILKCMEKDKEKRYQKTEELLSELINIEKGISTEAAAEQPQIPAFLIEPEEKVEEKRPVFVAREKELEKLSKFLEKTLGGQGRVAFITGEAGSGKTALANEFALKAQEAYDDLIVVSGKCDAHTGTGDPYAPFREILRMLTGDVEASWASGVISREHASRLWNLLPLSAQAIVDSGPDLIDTFLPGSVLVSRAEAFVSGSAAWLTRLKKLAERKASLPADATLQQSNLFGQYSRVLQALARQQPLLLILDDLHWADVGSINLLFNLGRQIVGSRILIMGTFRPAEVALGKDRERHPLASVINEFKRSFGDVEVELGEAEDRKFVDAFLDTEPNQLGVDFRETLLRQTKGHPLFTIELLREMQEQGMLIKDKKEQWVEGQTLNWEALPIRVDAIIEERIGRLTGNLRELLNLASVEGEEFTAEVVAKLQETDVRGLIRLLSSELDKRHHLISAKGIQRIDSQRLSLYKFQHILFQRYLYNGLDKVERAHLHEQVGNVLETIYGEQAEEIADQLARHFQEAGIAAKAVEYLQQAGNKAVLLSANEEAISHFNKGLELLKSLPDTPERIQKELAMLLSLGSSLMAAKGYAAPEVGRALTRARKLCQQIGETPQLFPVLFGLVGLYGIGGEYRTARELAEQMLNLAERAEDPLHIAIANLQLGYLLLHMGEFTQARAHLEHMIHFYNPEQHSFLAFIYGSDLGVFALGFTSWTLLFLGYPDQALKRSKETISLAQELDHPFSLIFALNLAGNTVNRLLHEVRASRKYSKEVMRLSREKGFVFYQGLALFDQGLVQFEEGQVEEGIAQMHQGLAVLQATGTEAYQTYLLSLLADAYRKTDKVEEGLKALTEALALVEKSDERFFQVELYRLKGELLLMQDEAQAEACFRQAIDTARRQNAKFFELRTVMSLSRLLQKQGKKEEAQKMLSDIYGWFTEGFNTPDLKEAKALLDELK